MSERRRQPSREDLLLLAASIALGLAAAAVFGAYQAVSASGEDTSAWFATFAANLLWPGLLIFGAAAAVVWVGWKANLD